MKEYHAMSFNLFYLTNGVGLCQDKGALQLPFLNTLMLVIRRTFLEPVYIFDRNVAFGQNPSTWQGDAFRLTVSVYVFCFLVLTLFGGTNKSANIA
jgi:hypothetical protein